MRSCIPLFSDWLAVPNQEPHRLVAFFDAIFAIVMTILVLSLGIPVGSHPESLAEITASLFPQLFHFVLAFAILTAFWISHHALFDRIIRLNTLLIRITFAILLVACLLPFTSGFAGDYPNNSHVMIFFHLNMVLLGLLFSVQWAYVARSPLMDPVSPVEFRITLIRSLITPGSAVVACLLTPFFPGFSSFAYFLIPIIRLISGRFAPEDDYSVESELPEGDTPVCLSIHPPSAVLTSLDTVSREMDLSREELVEKILIRWQQENQVVTGNGARLCTLSPDNEKHSPGC